MEELVDSSVSEADVRKDVAVQVGSWALPHSSLTWFLLRKHLASIVVATVLAFLLGFIAAAIGVLLGPTVKILMAAPGQNIPFKELFPETYLWLITEITGQSGMTSHELLSLVPVTLIILAAFKASFAGVSWFLWEKTGELVAKDLRAMLISQYLSTAPESLQTQSVQKVSEQIASLISTNIKVYRDYLVHYYGGLPRELLQVLFLLVSLVFLSPKLLGMFLFAVAPSLLLANYIAKRIKKRAAKALADNSTLIEWIQQRLLGIETIKQFRSEATEKRKFEQLTENLFQRYVIAAMTKARSSPTIEGFAILAMVLVLTYSLQSITAGESSGTIFMSFFATLALLSQAASNLGRYLNSNREGAAASEAITDALKALKKFSKKSISRQTSATHQGRGLIDCRDVTVQYQKDKDPALNDFSHRFESGQFYVICGASGAGKSTLFRAILNLQPPTNGTIEFKTDKASSLPIVYVPQQLVLLPGSIAQNVAYPRTELDLTKVRDCLEKVGLDMLIAELSGGIHTFVGDAGRQLSGGQNQRIMLARALYHESPFIILDEPTSALDPNLERVTLDLLDREVKVHGRGVIMIAHRPMALEYADEVILLDKGKIAGAGPFEVVRKLPLFQQAFGEG